jgi:hypothetical protein
MANIAKLERRTPLPQNLAATAVDSYSITLLMKREQLTATDNPVISNLANKPEI